MKKYFILPLALFALACNSNPDKVSDEAPETTIAADSTSGEGLLSGKFEIVDYKKENVTVKLPKTYMEFTRGGDVIKSDGVSFFYKIEGDSIVYMTSPGIVAYKSKIEFLNDDKSSFIIKTPQDNTETTYKKIN
ncbi:MAG TPA: hypothetical protein VI461_01800 [Chitinophagaceae bacterium]|nr:hypothetical protein [Chitinophagaceae bacterium]